MVVERGIGAMKQSDVGFVASFHSAQYAFTSNLDLKEDPPCSPSNHA